MGGCQNYGPFLGTLNNRCRILIGTPKGAIFLTTTHMAELLHLHCSGIQKILKAPAQGQSGSYSCCGSRAFYC